MSLLGTKNPLSAYVRRKKGHKGCPVCESSNVRRWMPYRGRGAVVFSCETCGRWKPSGETEFLTTDEWLVRMGRTDHDKMQRIRDIKMAIWKWSTHKNDLTDADAIEIVQELHELQREVQSEPTPPPCPAWHPSTR